MQSWAERGPARGSASGGEAVRPADGYRLWAGLRPPSIALSWPLGCGMVLGCGRWGVSSSRAEGDGQTGCSRSEATRRLAGTAPVMPGAIWGSWVRPGRRVPVRGLGGDGIAAHEEQLCAWRPGSL